MSRRPAGRFGVHRSTYYAWKRQVDRHGLEMLRPRRAPGAADAQPALEDGRGADRRFLTGPSRPWARSESPASCGAPKWGGIVVSPNGVWKVLCRHGLNTRAKRLGLIAGYAAPYEPPREIQAQSAHIDVARPGELVGIDCFFVGRLRGTEGAIWQLTAIDVASSFAWAELVVCKEQPSNPNAKQTSKLARRVAKRPPGRGLAAGALSLRQRQRVQGRPFTTTTKRAEGAPHPHPRRAPADQRQRRSACTRTILDECWRPAFARYLYPALHQPEARSRRPTCASTTSTAFTTAASPPARSQRTSSTVPARWRSGEPWAVGTSRSPCKLVADMVAEPGSGDPAWFAWHQDTRDRSHEFEQAERDVLFFLATLSSAVFRGRLSPDLAYAVVGLDVARRSRQVRVLLGEATAEWVHESDEEKEANAYEVVAMSDEEVLKSVMSTVHGGAEMEAKKCPWCYWVDSLPGLSDRILALLDILWAEAARRYDMETHDLVTAAELKRVSGSGLRNRLRVRRLAKEHGSRLTAKRLERRLLAAEFIRLGPPRRFDFPSLEFVPPNLRGWGMRGRLRRLSRFLAGRLRRTGRGVTVPTPYEPWELEGDETRAPANELGK